MRCVVPLLRVVEAFFISSVLGIVVGILSGMKPQFHAFLSPIIVAMQATPVMALILIAMFWFPASQVPVFSAVLMAFPLLYTSAEAGVHAADDKLVQLSTLFHVTRHTMFWKLRLPSALPLLLSGAKNALGISWKVVVAGEVLSQPRMALGTQMQESRLSLETSGVFSWAIVTIVLCGLSEFLFGIIVGKSTMRFEPYTYSADEKEAHGAEEGKRQE